MAVVERFYYTIRRSVTGLRSSKDLRWSSPILASGKNLDTSAKAKTSTKPVIVSWLRADEWMISDQSSFLSTKYLTSFCELRQKMLNLFGCLSFFTCGNGLSEVYHTLVACRITKGTQIRAVISTLSDVPLLNVEVLLHFYTTPQAI